MVWKECGNGERVGGSGSAGSGLGSAGMYHIQSAFLGLIYRQKSTWICISNITDGDPS